MQARASRLAIFLPERRIREDMVAAIYQKDAYVCVDVCSLYAMDEDVGRAGGLGVSQQLLL